MQKEHINAFFCVTMQFDSRNYAFWRFYAFLHCDAFPMHFCVFFGVTTPFRFSTMNLLDNPCNNKPNDETVFIVRVSTILSQVGWPCVRNSNKYKTNSTIEMHSNIFLKDTSCYLYNTLVNLYVDLVVFTRIAGT